MDMMPDFVGMDMMPGNDNINQIDFGQYGHERTIPRQDEFQETMGTFSSEFNMRPCQEMDSMMSMMLTQINRPISSGIAERVIPEI